MRPIHLASPALLAVGLTLALAACGSGESTTTATTTASATPVADDGVATAKAAVEKATATPRFTLDAKPFSMAKIAGKTIFNIPITSAIPYVVDVDQEAEKVAKSYGAKWVEYANQGTPTQWTSGINEAINQKADLIILSQGVASDLIVPAIKKAKAAGIPVLLTHTYQNGQKPSPQVAANIAGTVGVPFWEAARLSVDYAVSQSSGKADALIITSNEVPPSKGIVTAMQGEFKKVCAGCKVKVVNVPVADWASKISPEVQSAVRADPKLDWVLPIYDSMSLFGQAGITAAGGATKVKIASYNGTPAVLKLVQDGDIMAMDVGENITWLGWATMDQAGRILTGAPVVADGDEKTPLRVFTEENIADTGTPPAPDKGYGDAFMSGYKALWEPK